jgi:hypothetical protein
VPLRPHSQTTCLRDNERIVIMRAAPIQQNPHTTSSRCRRCQAKSHGTQRLIGDRDGASNRDGAARTLRAQEQLIRPRRPRLKAAHQNFQLRPHRKHTGILKAKRETQASVRGSGHQKRVLNRSTPVAFHTNTPVGSMT